MAMVQLPRFRFQGRPVGSSTAEVRQHHQTDGIYRLQQPCLHKRQACGGDDQTLQIDNARVATHDYHP